MTKLEGLGPKRARRLYDELGIDSLEALRAAADGGRIRELKGFGAKAEERAARGARRPRRAPRGTRVVLARAMTDRRGDRSTGLRAHPAVVRAEVAGSARRQADDVKDLDIVVASDDPAGGRRRVRRARGDRDAERGGERRRARRRADRAPRRPARRARRRRSATCSSTSPAARPHNVRLREMAVRRGLHVSEHGILDDATGETLRCETEEEVYAALDLPYIEPELRENRGELEPGASRCRELSRSATSAATCTATPSPATATRRSRRWRSAARERGHEYLAITDHSASHGFGNEVSPEALERQIEMVARGRRAARGHPRAGGQRGQRLPDGSLDYEDELLAQLDWVVASVHTSFRMSARRDDRAHDPRDRASARRRDRPPDGPPDRQARAGYASTSRR